MSTLLAYSTFHRAALLRYKAPKARIIAYLGRVSRIFSTTINKNKQLYFPETLATILLMISMSRAFKVLFTTSWLAYIRVARKLIDIGMSQIGKDYKIFSFLKHWYYEFDHQIRLRHSVDHQLPGDSGEGYACCTQPVYPSIVWIDCFWGTTHSGVCRLRRVIELARVPSQEKDVCSRDRNSDIWILPSQLQRGAEHLKTIIRSDALHNTGLRCYSPEQRAEDFHEMARVHQAYCYAFAILLNRRVLRLPSSDPHVQWHVFQILEIFNLYDDLHLPSPSMLFPLITARYEAQCQEHKRLVLINCRLLEAWGLSCVRCVVHLSRSLDNLLKSALADARYCWRPTKSLAGRGLLGVSGCQSYGSFISRLEST